MNTELEKLIDFKLEASKNTYAGYGEFSTPSRPDSHDCAYEKEEYFYYDTWLGGERFSGEEAIWKNGIPIYAMNYSGRNLDERFSGDFLKEALRNATKEMPYRGPEFYQAGEFTYKTKATGSMDWFQGYEEILWHDIKVYECYYHGGAVK